MEVINDLYDYENRYIIQKSDGFKFSIDSVLLAEYAQNDKNNLNILDLCAGNMAIPLIISKYNKSKIYGFEIQNEIYELGKKSIELNKVENLLIINDDVLNIKNYFNSDFFDIMVCNPPFFKVSDEKNVSQTKLKKYARHEFTLNLDNIFSIAKSHLKTKGSLYMVHRAERIDDIIISASKHNVNVKEIIFISTKKNKRPLTVLVKCVKNSKSGIKIQNEICIENMKTFKNMFKEIK